MLGLVNLVIKSIIKMKMVQQVYVLQKIEEAQIKKNPKLLNSFKLPKKSR
jgi:hypothetical protein